MESIPLGHGTFDGQMYVIGIAGIASVIEWDMTISNYENYVWKHWHGDCTSLDLPEGSL